MIGSRELEWRLAKLEEDLGALSAARLELHLAALLCTSKCIQATLCRRGISEAADCEHGLLGLAQASDDGLGVRVHPGTGAAFGGHCLHSLKL